MAGFKRGKTRGSLRLSQVLLVLKNDALAGKRPSRHITSGFALFTIGQENICLLWLVKGIATGILAMNDVLSGLFWNFCWWNGNQIRVLLTDQGSNAEFQSQYLNISRDILDFMIRLYDATTWRHHSYPWISLEREEILQKKKTPFFFILKDLWNKLNLVFTS